MADSTHTADAASDSARTQVKIVIPDDLSMVALLGSRDELLDVVERTFTSDVHVRGNEITITGPAEETELVAKLFEELLDLLKSGTPLAPDVIERSVAMLRAETGIRPAEVLTLDILSSRGRTIRPKTLNQKNYVDAIDKHTIVFAIGPAGTGKTYLAMAKAVKALQAKEVNRIILTRPAVEAGERLGFLPGTLYEKIDPYLRPLYDALHDMIDPDSIPRLMAAGTIEVAPLAYMRGRAHPVFTNVLTPDGWRPIGDLQVGDLVVGSNGEPTPVLGVYPQGEKDVYRVSAQDGAWTLCCGEHLWTVRTAADKRRTEWRVLETREMIGDLRTADAHRYELPLLTAPVRLPEREVPADPYALGLLLGGGHPAGSAPDHGPGQAVAVAGPATKVLRESRRTRAETAFVPDVYLDNAADVRLAVLQGLLDTGGEPVARAGRACGVRFATASAVLRADVVTLVRSLGGVARLDNTHIVDVRLPEGVEPFRLVRKRERYHAAGSGGRPARFVDSIEPAGREECVCIQVAAEDSLYVTQDYLLTHNTLNDSFIILDEAQNTSPEQMKMFLTRLGFGSKVVVTGDVTQVDLPSGQQSGLQVVQEILDGIDDISFRTLTSKDVVRHKLVGQIVDAYNRHDSQKRPPEFTQNAAGRGPRKRGR